MQINFDSLNDVTSSRTWFIRTWLAGLLLLVAGVAIGADKNAYDVMYHAEFVPAEGVALVTVEVRQDNGRLRELDFDAPEFRYSNFRGTGSLRREDTRLIWSVPRTGGRLTYRVVVNTLRGNSHDALITSDWAILRLDDLFPPARARSLVAAYSRASLMLSGPTGWSFETGYGRVDAPVQVINPDRRFVRPVGWLAAGELGVRRSKVAERQIVVAAPTGESFRRMDLLAFINWTLPELVTVFPMFPDRVLVVAGNRDMWRGALSGPNSLYLHSERPLISENATSTLLHELVHVAMPNPPAPHDDWIAEGLAEYYSLKVLRRSGGIGQRRFEAAFEKLEAWAERDRGRLADPSAGANTAFATLLFADLDRELQVAGSGLDLIVAKLFAGREINRYRLRDLVEAALGEPSKVLQQTIAQR
jgi:hypothetical protein